MKTQRVSIFISYAERDKRWLKKILTHLKPLLRKHAIKLWSDQQIQPGQNGLLEIQTALSQAQVAVLLVSSDYLASEWVARFELPTILRQQEQGLTVWWVPLRACLYEETEIAHFQAVFSPSRPLASLQKTELEEALVQIGRAISPPFHQPAQGPMILTGTQTFEVFRDPRHNYLYVDKTRWIADLLKEGRVYFISRPRRFGKSLFLSTLEALFQGRQDLFCGLAIEKSAYDFNPHPVIRIDFSNLPNQTSDHLEKSLHWEIDRIANKFGLEPSAREMAPEIRFQELVERIGSGGSQVVILVDEYDKPILDQITHEREARRNREVLTRFYTTIKAIDHLIHFVFITGVSKFSKVSVFSGLNNLEDLSFHPRYAGMLGLTEQEIQTRLHSHISTFASDLGLSTQRVLEKLRTWYDGYRFSTRNFRVYNPWSVFLALKRREFQHFWYETGTPTFLLEIIKQNPKFELDQLEHFETVQATLESFDVDHISLVPLLYQTGYLTIREVVGGPDDQRYVLGYPNFEVKQAFATSLLDYFTQAKGTTAKPLRLLHEALQDHDLESFFLILNRDFLSEIPYDMQIRKEKYYQSIFHLILLLLGLKIRSEEKTNIGRIDSVLDTGKHIYLFEYKYRGTAAKALEQIHQKRYYDKFLKEQKPITLVGVNFQDGGVTDYRAEFYQTDAWKSLTGLGEGGPARLGGGEDV